MLSILLSNSGDAMKEEEIPCSECGALFIPWVKHKKTCSEKCSYERRVRLQREVYNLRNRREPIRITGYCEVCGHPFVTNRWTKVRHRQCEHKHQREKNKRLYQENPDIWKRRRAIKKGLIKSDEPQKLSKLENNPLHGRPAAVCHKSEYQPLTTYEICLAKIEEAKEYQSQGIKRYSECLTCSDWKRLVPIITDRPDPNVIRLCMYDACNKQLVKKVVRSTGRIENDSAFLRRKYCDYQDFLSKKEIVDNCSGFEPLQINPMLFDFQKAIVTWACRRGRAAIFADCGLGKSPMQLEWANQVHQHTNQPILILAPLAVSKQTKREGEKFGITVNICESQDDVINGINITNYEKLHKFDSSSFSGIVLDESSILKSYTGKFRNSIIEAFSRTPYKLACTATPSPNDFTELGNHSEFLNILTRSEMLSMFFINDTSNVGTWRLKGHGQEKFWKWLCSWSVMMSKPSELGFSDNGFILPKLNIIENVIEFGKALPGQLFPSKAETLSERRQARSDSINEKIEIVKQLTNNTDQWLIWCDLNKESDSIFRSLPDAVEVTGSQDDDTKESLLYGFINGSHRILVTKGKIAGFGLNLQNCHNIIFVGLSDSYEAYYQEVRRCWRFGQMSEVNCHIITTDIEGNVVDNVRRKEADAQKMRQEMIKHMQDISREEIRQSSHARSEYRQDCYHGDNYELHLGDNVELIKNIPDDSIGLSIFSPPFASLFTYSDSIRDMGNCRGKDDFLQHFKFLVTELYRVMMPGRLICVHCMNLPATITHDGFIGIHDFRGEIIRLFESEKFIYHSEVCIWKDPLVQAVRTKVLSLAHKQIVKDSSRCGQGLPDYIVVMRKPGDNPRPIEHPKGLTEYIGERDFTNTNFHEDQRKNKLSHEIWQRYASPVWFDIRQTRVLSTELARDDKDEKHVCPLQLDTIERCLELWSAKGDIVFDPFAGIGSTPYSAVSMGRYGIGIELKESYWNQSIKNMQHLEVRNKQADLFSYNTSLQEAHI